MTKSQRAALAKFVMRGKEHLVLIRPYRDVLMLHTMHYADEIRSSEQVDHGAKTSVGASELKLAERLIDDLSKDKFEADKFQDTYRQKILKVAEQKAAGQEITAPPAPKRGKVIDLMAALKDSLKSYKKDAPKESEDEVAHDDRSGSREKGVRRAHRVQGTRKAAAWYTPRRVVHRYLGNVDAALLSFARPCGAVFQKARS